MYSFKIMVISVQKNLYFHKVSNIHLKKACFSMFFAEKYVSENLKYYHLYLYCKDFMDQAPEHHINCNSKHLKQWCCHPCFLCNSSDLFSGMSDLEGIKIKEKYSPTESGLLSEAPHSGLLVHPPEWKIQKYLLHPPRPRCWSPSQWSLCAGPPCGAPCRNK